MTNFSSKIYGQTIDFKQAQNGDPAAFPVDFTNGILNATQTTYYEGLGIPQRMIFTGLDPTAAKYTVFFRFLAGIPNKGVHAYDFLMSWEQAELTARKIGGALSGTETENELQNLFSSGCATAPAECAALSSNLLPAANIKRPNIPDMPGGGAFYSGVPANITCFENTFGDRDMEIRGNQAITSAVLSFTGYTGDYANFKLEWISTSTNIMIRYASRAAVGDGGAGNFACGYGVGKGAGSISGGNYHNIFDKLTKNNNNNSEIQGSRDNQLSAGAIMPVAPPSCPTINPQSACPETTSIAYSVTPETGVTYKWSLTNGTPTANAKLQGADANGFVTGTSVTVVPISGTFAAGGTFNLTLVLSKTGVADVTCNYPSIGSITKVVVTATADPTVIDLTSAAHNTTLTANIGAASTFPLNTDYSYQWSIVTGGTSGGLTNDATRIATYTAATNDPTSITFKVVATLIATGAPACKDSAEVTVTLTGGPPCTVSPSDPVCQGTQNVHNGPSPIPANATYTWSTTGFGGSGTTTSSPVGATNGVSVTINAIQSYRVVLTQTFANPALNTSCHQDVTVIPTPTVSAIYNPPGCTENTFSIDIPNSVSTSSYRVTQGVSPNFTYNVTKAGNDDTLNFAGLAAGGGFEVEVTTGTASCKATTNCASSTNSCTNGAITENRGGTTPQTGVATEPETYKVVLESPTKVNATPNPYTEKVRFDLVSGVSGYGTLELYNTIGQRIGIVYQGHIQAGRPLVRDYSITKGSKSTVIYVFKVGDQKVTGKLLNLK